MTKTVEISLPNLNTFATNINDDDGALAIINKIEKMDPQININNIILKKHLSEDDIKLGEKEYDFTNIRNGEKIKVLFNEPIYEKLEDVIPITRLAGLNFYGKQYIHCCRYHFIIKDAIYQNEQSMSILYDMDFRKFALEPVFHKCNYSVLNDFKPFMSSDRPIFDGRNYSMNYNPVWYNTLRELLDSINIEGFHLSIKNIENIEKLYEKHKIIIYNS